MIRIFVVILFFYLPSSVVNLQPFYPSSDDFDYNTKVDLILEGDHNYRLDTSFHFGNIDSELMGKEEMYLLEGIPEINSFLLNKIISAKSLSDKEKTSFLSNYLAENDSLFYSDISIVSSINLPENEVTYRLLNEYYRGKEIKIFNEELIANNYLDFYRINALNDNCSTLENYMQSRNILNYTNYILVPLAFIECGKEKEGVRLSMDWLDEYGLTESTTYVTDRQKQLSEFLPKLYFQLKDTSSRVYILNKIYDKLEDEGNRLDQLDDDLIFFLEYVSGDRFYTLLIKKIESLIGRINEKQVVGNTDYYVHRLIVKYRNFLGRSDGERIWVNYLKYLDFKSDYDHSRISLIAADFLLDENMNSDVKNEILNRIQTGTFSDKDSVASYLIDRFLIAILYAYPDMKNEGVKEFFPESYHRNLTSLIRQRKMWINAKKISYEERIEDFIDAGIIENRDFSELETYYVRLSKRFAPDNVYFLNSVLRSNSRKFTSLKGLYMPIDHKFIYKEFMEPLLSLNDIEINFKQYDLDNGEARVVLSYNDFHRSYVYSRSSMSTIFFMLKAVNLMFADIGVRERLFSLDNSGLKSSILLIEPNILADISVKHNYKPQMAGIREFGGLFE